MQVAGPWVEIEVTSDLYYAGRTEDGREYHAEVFYVVVANDYGDRLAHVARFPGCVREIDEDGYPHFADVREAARAQAEQLADRVKAAGGPRDRSHWQQARPVYGSDAFVAYGQLDDWITERMEAAEEGFR